MQQKGGAALHIGIVSLVLALALSAVPLQAGTVCTLLLDAGTSETLREEGDCSSRVTPASTFKIALAVMGYDAGILKTAHDPVMAYRTGDPDWGGADWLRDTDPTSWMRYSVVWYSQRIAHDLGAPALTRYARSFGYGNADFAGDPGFDNGLDRAWIASSLQISPREQALFLRALLTDALPVAPRAMAQARALVETRRSGDWLLHGKTGGAYPRRADRSFDYARGWGWYVGWAENGGRTLIFVTLTQATEQTRESPGLLAREAFLRDWPALVGDD